MSRPLAILAAALLLPGLAGAQTLAGRTDSIYTWRGPLGAQARLTIRNHGGPIDVRPAAGREVEFRAEKLTSRGGGAIRDVAFETRTSSGGDVTICATFRDRNPCDAGRRGSGDDDDDDYRGRVTVAITVLVPRGAQVRVVTGNGALSVERVGGEVEATTGNGRVRVAGTGGRVRVTTGNGAVEVRDAKAAVRVTTGDGDVTVATQDGPVEARSGNGDIDVRIAARRVRDDMSFSTGNGAVRLTLPASYSGELDATTGDGEMRSDFELEVHGRITPRRIRATIGEGGPLLKLSTGSGRVEVRKGS
ncbi:MAG: hypothetical protein JWL60_1504 [Gemmatimonadetes bacterium]|nr:hypothetical protein [Gemmatimonadota bacterium]